MRLLPEQLVVVQLYSRELHLKHCYFVGSSIKEIPGEVPELEYTSLYYSTSEGGYYFAIRYTDDEVVGMAFIVPIGQCWVAVLLPNIIIECRRDKDPDRIYDSTVDYYFDIAPLILPRIYNNLAPNLKKRDVFHDQKSAKNQLYCCELIHAQPYFHHGEGEFETCYEYTVTDDYWNY
jgi:hypothetical protein